MTLHPPAASRRPHPSLAEAARLAELDATGLLDGPGAPAQPTLDGLTRLAAWLLRAPTALVSLVGPARQVLVSGIGLPEPWATRRETPLSHSGCQHVASASPLVVEDRRTVAWDHVVLRGADDAVVGVASVGQDVTERQALERRLAALSEHDELTGLLNRRGFNRMASHALKSAHRSRRHDAVLYIDLDRFKPINDTYGHAAGDDALRAVADLLRTSLRDADFAARLGGDEFAVFAVGLHVGEGQVIAARLRASLDAHNAAAAAAGRPFRIEFSVGVAEVESGDALLARADGMLYARKLARRTEPIARGA